MHPSHPWRRFIMEGFVSPCNTAHLVFADDAGTKRETAGPSCSELSYTGSMRGARGFTPLVGSCKLSTAFRPEGGQVIRWTLHSLVALLDGAGVAVLRTQ